MTNTATRFAAYVVLDGIQDPSARCELLAQLTEWADSEEGRDYRAGQGHAGSPSPITVEDILGSVGDSCLEAIFDTFPELDEANDNED